MCPTWPVAEKKMGGNPNGKGKSERPLSAADSADEHDAVSFGEITDDVRTWMCAVYRDLRARPH